MVSLKLIICCTYTEQPGGLRSCAAAPAQDATPDSPAFSHSCYAGGAGSSSWTRTRPLWCGSGTGLAGRCPRRDEEAGGPRLDRKQPHGTTGPPPGPQAPGRRWVRLMEAEEKQSEFRTCNALREFSPLHSKMCFASCCFIWMFDLHCA